jgi:hypothetical protein
MCRSIIMSGVLTFGLASIASAQGIEEVLKDLQALQTSVNTLQTSLNSVQASVNVVQTISNNVLAAVNGERLQPYQQFSGTSCNIPGDCTIIFPAVTANTLILHASCIWLLPNSANVVADGVSLSVQGPQQARQHFPFFANASLQGNVIYTFNADTYLFVDSGSQPRIDVSSEGAAVTNFSCTISGKVP